MYFFFYVFLFLCISFFVYFFFYVFLSPLNKQKKHTHIAAFAAVFSAREIARHCDTRSCDLRYSSDRTFWKTRYFDGTYAMVRMLSWSFIIRVMIRCPFLTWRCIVSVLGGGALLLRSEISLNLT